MRGRNLGLLGALLLDSHILRLQEIAEKNRPEPAPPPPYDLRLIQPQPETRQQRRFLERQIMKGQK